MKAQWARKSVPRNSQEVGLEAAILERVRNSSLVEESCADNVTGLKLVTEAVASMTIKPSRGRGAFPFRRSYDVNCGGGAGSENAGMSSVNSGENPEHRKPEVSYATAVGVGLGGPKP